MSENYQKLLVKGLNKLIYNTYICAIFLLKYASATLILMN